MAFAGFHPGNFESELMNRFVPGDGMYRREALPLLGGVWNDNGTLKDWAASTTGTVGFALITTTLLGLRWEATADQTDCWYYPWSVPMDYRRDPGLGYTRTGIKVRVRARKVDISGSASDNTDLALTMQAFWQSPAIADDTGAETAGGTSVSTLATAVSNTLNALAASDDEDADPENFRWYEFDISNAMTDAQRAALKPGASLTLSLYPNEAPGTGIAVDVLAVEVVYTGHPIPAPRVQRLAGVGVN